MRLLINIDINFNFTVTIIRVIILLVKQIFIWINGQQSVRLSALDSKNNQCIRFWDNQD